MKPLNLPDTILKALDIGGYLGVGVSGGKDSQAMLTLLAPMAQERGWWIEAVHADLGRAEWSSTPAEVERQCAALGVPLTIVRRKAGDLFDRMEQRERTLAGTGKPHWPSSASRYCTAELKRDPIDTYFRSVRSSLIVSAEGIRAEESKTRSHKPPFQERVRLAARGRVAYTWNPLLYHTIEDVWEILGTSVEDVENRRALYAEGNHEAALAGWRAHPAYVYGMQRLSCAFCVLASNNDLTVSARHNPEQLQYLVQMERRTGFTFKQGFALESLVA